MFCSHGCFKGVAISSRQWDWAALIHFWVFHVPCFLNFLIGGISYASPSCTFPYFFLLKFLECELKIASYVVSWRREPTMFGNMRLVSVFPLWIIRILFCVCTYKCNVSEARTRVRYLDTRKVGVSVLHRLYHPSSKHNAIIHWQNCFTRWL